MKQDRNIIIKILDENLIEYNRNGVIKELISSKVLDDYIDKRRLTKILTTNMPLKTLNETELIYISILLKNFKSSFNINEYFTDTEISDALSKKGNLKMESSSLIIFKNLLYSRNNGIDTWICLVTYRQLYDMMKSGKIVYNMETQRQGIVRKVKGKRWVVPYINDDSVEEIKNQMKSDEFYSNMISINITPDYRYTKLDYSSADNTLIIDTDKLELAVIDGMHRITGAMKAVEENPDIEGELYLKITNMSVEKAQGFIRQEAKGNAQNRKALEKYNPDNKVTQFIKNINGMDNEKSNVLYRKIEFEVNKDNGLIPFEMFKDGLEISGFIDDIDNTDDFMELKDMEIYIVNFFLNFYNIAKRNEVPNDLLTDPTFIMGLLITCHKYCKDNIIDINAMNIVTKKLKTTKTNYTYEYDNELVREDKKNMLTKFSKLLEVE